jgi:hypothetical protein
MWATRAIPCHLRPGCIVLRHGGALRALCVLIGEGVMGKVTVAFVAHRRFEQPGFQGVDIANRESRVLYRPNAPSRAC